MKITKFLLLFALACSALLYFGTHAEFGTIQWFTMTVAAVLNIGALLFAINRLPEFLSSRRKQEGDK